jgi:tetratricopeptide (TPR) repeat protein
LRGAEGARRHIIPIHVVGIGDPRQPWNLRLDGQTVETVLKEKLLQDLAQRTGGVYIPAHRASQLPLGRLLREVQGTRQAQWTMAPDIVASKENTSQGLPQKIGRHAWFLAAALALFTAMLLIPLRPAPLVPPSRRPDFPAVPAAGRRATRTAKAVVALTALVLISAAPLPSVEEYIRQGNQAYHRGEFADALQLYDQAAAATLDPGLVAFNQGAALFRLERFDEAASHYRRCLEDAAIPQERRARAQYDLGNALVQQAKAVNARLLDQAAQAYRACLESATDPILKTDAAHNLEVARWLWKQALARPQPEPPGTEKQPNDPKKQADPNPKNTEDDPKEKDHGKASKDPGKEGKDDPGLFKDKGNGKDKKDHPGALLVIPELQQVEQGKVTPEQSAAFLEEQAQRIRGERRLYRREASRGGEGVPNW